jgi:hypothetical protein
MMKPRLQSNLPKKVLFTVALMVLCGITLVALAVITPPTYQVYSSATDPNVIAGAPLTYWYPQENQLSVKNAAGSFEIKDYVIEGLKIYLFYVMAADKPGLPQVTILSSDAGPFQPLPKPDSTEEIKPTATVDINQAKTFPVNSVQTIATFDRVEVGIIKAEVVDQPNQLVTFLITPPGSTQTAWQLTPFHQINSVGKYGSRQGGTSLQTYQPQLPWYTDVNVEMPIFGGDENTMGVIKITRAGSATPPLYFQVDAQGNLTPFSQADCARMFPPPPTNPPPQGNGPVTATIAVPAPCNGNF